MISQQSKDSNSSISNSNEKDSMFYILQQYFDYCVCQKTTNEYQLKIYCRCPKRRSDNIRYSKQNQAGQSQFQHQAVLSCGRENLIQFPNADNHIPIDPPSNHRMIDVNQMQERQQDPINRKQRDNIKNNICSTVFQIDDLQIQNYSQFVWNNIKFYKWDKKSYRNYQFLVLISLKFRKQKLQNNLNLERIKNWINQKCRKVQMKYENSRYLYKISNCLKNGFLKIIQSQDFQNVLQGIINIYSTKTKNLEIYIQPSSKKGIRTVYDLLKKEQNINEKQLHRYKEYMIERKCWIAL